MPSQRAVRSQVNLNAHGSGDPEWVDVTPVPGALTVNVGDMLQVLSNGKYKAPEHRVLASPPGKVRYSAPFFYNPAYDAEIAPLDKSGAASLLAVQLQGVIFGGGASRATSRTRGWTRFRLRTT